MATTITLQDLDLAHVVQPNIGVQDLYEQGPIVFDEGRDNPPEEAARLTVYLASGQADALTGRYLSVTFDVPDLVRRTAEVVDKDLLTLCLRT